MLTLTMREATEIADLLGQADPYCRLDLENDEILLEIMRRGRGLVVRFVGTMNSNSGLEKVFQGPRYLGVAEVFRCLQRAI